MDGVVIALLIVFGIIIFLAIFVVIKQVLWENYREKVLQRKVGDLTKVADNFSEIPDEEQDTKVDNPVCKMNN